VPKFRRPAVQYRMKSWNGEDRGWATWLGLSDERVKHGSEDQDLEVAV
jgi:hypothetical protein